MEVWTGIVTPWIVRSPAISVVNDRPGESLPRSPLYVAAWKTISGKAEHSRTFRCMFASRPLLPVTIDTALIAIRAWRTPGCAGSTSISPVQSGTFPATRWSVVGSSKWRSDFSGTNRYRTAWGISCAAARRAQTSAIERTSRLIAGILTEEREYPVGHVGSRGPGREGVAQSGKERRRVVPGERIRRRQAVPDRSRDCRAIGEGAGIGGIAVDPVGAGGEDGRRIFADLECRAEHELLAAAPPAGPPAQGNRCLAPGEEKVGATAADPAPEAVSGFACLAGERAVLPDDAQPELN